MAGPNLLPLSTFFWLRADRGLGRTSVEPPRLRYDWPVDFMTVDAIMESSRLAYRGVKKGKLLACRMPDLNLQYNSLVTFRGWEKMHPYGSPIMSTKPNYATPYNAYPRDVTSPGPYQQRGIAQSQTCPTSSSGDGPQPAQKRDDSDKPSPAPERH